MGAQNPQDSSGPTQRQGAPPAYSSSLGGTSTPEIEEERRQRDAAPSPGPASLISQEQQPPSRRGHPVRFREFQRRDSDEYDPQVAADIVCAFKMLTPRRLKLPSGTKEHIKYFMKAALSDDESLIYFWTPRSYSKQPPHHGEDSISIGDVGIFSGEFGNLDKKFNIFLSEHENRQRGYRPPNDFIPYAASLKDRYFSENRREMSKAVMSVAGGWQKRRTLTADQRSEHVMFSLEKQSLIKAGSALVLPDGFIKIKLSGDVQERVDQYILEQGKSWYDGDQPQSDDPEKKRKTLKNGSLVVVLGCCVAPTWAVASHRGVLNFSSETFADLKKNNPEVDLYVWHAGNTICASGPGLQDLQNGRAVNFNQCVAIEAYTIHIRSPNAARSAWSMSSLFSSVGSLARTIS